MKRYTVMIKPVSSLCNLRCKYCFYKDVSSLRENCSYGVMELSFAKKMIERMGAELQDGDEINFGFQGGEPTLAGLSYYREFVKTVSQWKKKIRVTYAFQTNALLLDEEWCSFLGENHFLVGVSYDILPEMHNEVRVDGRGKGTDSQVLRAIRLLKKYRVEYNILCTLTKNIARHPDKVWREIEKHDFRYVQFTPCLDELESEGASIYALAPERFAAFYIGIFGKWETAYRRGNYRSIKLIDDMVNLLAYGVPTGCGMNGRCQPQLVMEADGSVYPCDFYCLDEFCIGNIMDQTLEELQKRSLESEEKKRKTLPERCGECPYLNICGGNCPRMRKEICFADGQECCGYRMLWEQCGGRLARLAKEQRNITGYR